MQIEPFENEAGYRVWLNRKEDSQFTEFYGTEPKKKLSVELMLDGLRSKEVTNVSKEDFREMQTEEEGYMLQIPESKTGYRECPVSAETRNTALTVANTMGLSKSEPIVDVSKRTVQRWVTDAAEQLAESTGKETWNEVSAHDLRRTWATHTYWRIEGDRAREVVMSWGGWEDVQTFSSNYLGKVPDSVAIDIMHEADLV
jgi:integrase